MDDRSPRTASTLTQRIPSGFVGSRARSARRATYAFIDVETTGVDPHRDRVVEIACIVVREGTTLASFSSLVNPGRTIPATAAAVHHITDRDVATAPPLVALEARLRELCADAVIVAHNARFDLAFLPFFAAHRVVCSMRLAMHVIPDAPNFKNQVLRYHLGVNDGMPAGVAAHRALGDATVTSRIFAICLERYLASAESDDVDALIAAIAAPRSLPTFPFGLHRGTSMGAVPDDYLQWLLGRSSVSDDVRFTARLELERRRRNVA